MSSSLGNLKILFSTLFFLVAATASACLAPPKCAESSVKHGEIIGRTGTVVSNSGSTEQLSNSTSNSAANVIYCEYDANESQAKSTFKIDISFFRLSNTYQRLPRGDRLPFGIAYIDFNGRKQVTKIGFGNTTTSGPSIGRDLKSWYQNTLNRLSINEWIDGARGSDTISGGDGDDYFFAGSGDDVLAPSQKLTKD